MSKEFEENVYLGPSALGIVNRGYESLAEVLTQALNQAQNGKGAERHANGLPFDKQRMQTLSHLLGSPDGMAFQACKKVTEGLDLPTVDAQVREMLGAINYIAGIVIYLQGTIIDEGTKEHHRTAKNHIPDASKMVKSQRV